MNSILFILFAVTIPFIAEFLCKKWKFFSYLGNVVLCYLLGILLVNTGIIKGNDELREILSSISVPLAIGLLLLTGDLKAWFKSAPKAVLSFVCLILSTLTFAAIGYYFFKDKIEGAEYYAGFFSAVYSGGSANMAAVNMATSAPKGLYDIAMIADVVLGGFFLIYTMGIAPHLYKKLLPATPIEKAPEIQEYKFSILELLKGIGLVAIATGIAAGVSFLFLQKIEAGLLIMVLTSLCAVFSLSPKVRSLESSKKGGDYFLLLFATVMGLSSDLSLFEWDALNVLYYMAFVMLGSMFLHLILSILFKIDRDTHLITSTAGVMSPPFIPGVAAALKNRGILMTGLTAGILGNLIGTYLGILMVQFFK